jgi:hypothetical protein
MSVCGMTDDLTTAELRAAFLLGATMGELHGRIEVAALSPTLGVIDVQPETPADAVTALRTSFLPYVKAGSDVAWVTSMWRVLFYRLSQLHNTFFPNSTTLNTRYDPGQNLPPYLFPTDPPDYATVGIGPEPEGALILKDFRLHEVTRRALNCLTLLYIEPRVSLLPAILEEEQARLEAAVLQAANLPETTPAADADHKRAVTVSIVTGGLLLFLRAWEGFLRESFYTAGVSANDQVKLIAFEAGLSLAALSWQITVQARAPQPATSPESEAARLGAVWAAAFADDRISRLQYQVGMVGKALDDATRAEGGTSTATAQEAAFAVTRSMDYWQRTIVWLNSQGSTSAHGPLTDRDWDRLRINLIEQAGIWQALVLGQQDLDTYSAAGVGQAILQDVATRFEKAVAGQGLFGAANQVSQALVDEVRVATDQLQAASAVVGTAARSELDQMLGAVMHSFWPIIAVLALIAALGVVVLVTHATSDGSGSLLADIATPLLGLAGAVGLFTTRRGLQSSVLANGSAVTQAVGAAVKPVVGLAVTPAGLGGTPVAGLAGAASGAGATAGGVAGAEQVVVDRSVGLVERLGVAAGGLGSSVLTDFNRGFDQAQADLKRLGHSVGMSYPLIEFFVLDSAWGNIRADVSFMNEVIWNDNDRRGEIASVVSAAFGSLGVFAMAANESA